MGSSYSLARTNDTSKAVAVSTANGSLTLIDFFFHPSGEYRIEICGKPGNVKGLAPEINYKVVP